MAPLMTTPFSSPMCIPSPPPTRAAATPRRLAGRPTRSAGRSLTTSVLTPTVTRPEWTPKPSCRVLCPSLWSGYLSRLDVSEGSPRIFIDAEAHHPGWPLSSVFPLRETTSARGARVLSTALETVLGWPSCIHRRRSIPVLTTARRRYQNVPRTMARSLVRDGRPEPAGGRSGHT